jgi:hypothetical protein
VIETFDRHSGDWSTFGASSGVIHHAIEPAETFDSEFHQGFSFRWIRCVRPVKRHVFAQLFFQSLSLSHLSDR